VSQEALNSDAKPQLAGYRFGAFTLDLLNRELRRDDTPIPLQPKTFDLLLVLVERRGRVAAKDELLSAIWPDTIVEESNLTQNIYLLRKVLGQDAEGRAYIETAPKRGYRFAAAATELWRDDRAPKGATAPGRTARRLFWLGTVIAIAVLLTAFVAAAAWWALRPWPVRPLDRMRLERVTTNGRAGAAAISPDGKYVVHAERGAGTESLILRQVATGGSAIIRPSEPVQYQGLMFSRDGGFIYYLRTSREGSDIYRVETLGGTPQRIVVDASAVSSLVGTPMALSPDDKRIAFLRTLGGGARQSVVVASVDETAEHTLVEVDVRTRLGTLAWSHNGRMLAFAELRPDEGGRMTLRAVGPNGEPARAITMQERWIEVRGLAWAPDDTALLMTARSEADNSEQIWRVEYPSGDLHRVTNDMSAYSGVSIAADGASLATVTLDFATEIWISDANDAGRGRALVSGTVAKEGLRGLTTTPDGHIVYESEPNGDENIWIMQMDGGAPRQLTRGSKLNIQPSVCPGGRIVFSSNRSGTFAIWRIDADGARPTQLTTSGLAPTCAPDGRFVAFNARDADGRPQMWKVSIDGGAPSRLAEASGNRLSFSPDGRWIACVFRSAAGQPQIGILPASGGEPRRVADAPPEERAALGTTAAVQWTRDGASLSYVAVRNGQSNLWRVPIAGGAPERLTDFHDERSIVKFAWSPDGTRVICSRAMPLRDVVLIRGFR